MVGQDANCPVEWFGMWQKGMDGLGMKLFRLLEISEYKAALFYLVLIRAESRIERILIKITLTMGYHLNQDAFLL